jgi:hypothetical protein
MSPQSTAARPAALHRRDVMAGATPTPPRDSIEIEVATPLSPTDSAADIRRILAAARRADTADTAEEVSAELAAGGLLDRYWIDGDRWWVLFCVGLGLLLAVVIVCSKLAAEKMI